MVQKKSKEPKDEDVTGDAPVEHLPWPPVPQFHALPPKATGGLQDMNGHDIKVMREKEMEPNEVAPKSDEMPKPPAFVQLKSGNYTEELIDKKADK